MGPNIVKRSVGQDKSDTFSSSKVELFWQRSEHHVNLVFKFWRFNGIEVDVCG